MQPLVVRQHRERIHAEEVAIPDADQAHQHRQIVLERRGAEVLVHFVTAFQHQLELIHAERQRDRQSDGRPHRVAAADPVPHREAVLRRNQKRIHRLARWSRRRRSAAPARPRPADRRSTGARASRCVSVSSVVNVFEHTTNSVRAAIDLLEHVAELHAVDVRDAVQAQIAIAELRQRLGRHHDAEIGAADADVDDVGEGLAGRAVNASAVHAFDEVAHLLEARAHFRHHVLAVDAGSGDRSDCAAPCAARRDSRWC